MARFSLEEFLAANDPLQAAQARNTPIRLPNGKTRFHLSDILSTPPVPKDPPGLVGGALKRGALTVGSDFSATAGVIASAFGADETAQGFFDRAAELGKSRDAITRRVGRVEDIDSLGDLGIFALETLLENAPLLASIAIPGLASAKIVSFAGASARSSRVVGTLGAFLADVGLQTGESAQIVIDAGGNPNDIRVVGSGLGKGALDFIPILTLARRLGLSKGLVLGETLEKEIGKQLVERGFVRRAIGNVSTLIAVEVPTETAQEIINIALDRSISQFEGELTPEEKSQLLNAAGGAAAFGLLGVPASIARPRSAPQLASEDDLDAGEGVALLEGPDELPRLPAPALRVTPEGDVLPHGVEGVSYDPALDTPIGLTAVQEGVRHALGRPTRKSVPNFVVTPDGVAIPQEIDPIESEASVLRAIPEALRTPIESQIIAVDDARAASIQEDVYEIPLPEEIQQRQPVLIETLLQARDDTFIAEGFRRSDGQLTVAGRARVRQIDKKIALIAKRLGVPNPLVQEELEIENAEEQLPAFNAAQEEQTSQRADPLLTEAESALLERLEEKDITEGLSTREEDQREELIAKRSGEAGVGRLKLSPAEVQRLRKLGAEIGDDESLQQGPDALLSVSSEALLQRNLNNVLEELLAANNRQSELSSAVSKIEKLLKAFGNSVENINSDEQLRAAFEASKLSGNLADDLHFRIDPNLTEMSIPLTRGEPNTVGGLLREFRELQKALPELRADLLDATVERGRLEERKTFLEGEQVRLRKGMIKGKRAFTVEKATEIVRKLASKFVRGPEIIVANSTDTTLFPKDSQRKRDIQGIAQGAFFPDEPNRIYVFADRHSNEADLQRTVLHETLAHFGLRAFLTEKEMNSLLERLYATRGPEIQARFPNEVIDSRQKALQFAEEYIGDIAETDLDLSTLQRVIAVLRRAFRRIAPNLKMTDNDIRFMLRDVSRFITGRIPSRNTGGIQHHMSAPEFMRMAGRSNIEGALPAMDSFFDIWGAKFGAALLTPLQIAERANVPGATEYIEKVQLWWARKRTLTNVPAELAGTWQSLPKREANTLAQAIFEISERSDEFDRRLTDQEILGVMKKLKASPAVMKLYREIDQSFKDVLTSLQNGMEKTAIRKSLRNHSDPKAEAARLHKLWKQSRKAFMQEIFDSKFVENLQLGARLVNIENQMKVLQNQNYFPRMRFGQWAFTVRAVKDQRFKGKEYKKGEVLSYETFESVTARKQRAPSLGQQFADQSRFDIREGKVSDKEFSFLGMPPALFDLLGKELGLNQEQKNTLEELFFRYSPGKAFLRHLTKRKGIAGFSTDAMRVYATYMMNAANHIARVEFSDEMADSLSVIEQGAKAMNPASRAGIVRDYFQNHFSYIMNPENDLAKYRAVGFLWYLGFNVKSAFVNLTQVPMVAYPFLAHHYGDGAATAALARAYGVVSKMKTGRLVLDQATDAHLQRAIAEGFVDESQATELAGLGESSKLQRLMGQDANTRLINRVAYYGSFLFKHAEKFNREVVFLAARELALKTGKNQEDAFRAGRKAVQATMFEYAKWNRPAFMRGKKSVFFLFWQFMQHLSFMAYGGEGKGPAIRVWLGLMLAAGAQGLPFAENFFDIVDFGSTQIKQALGSKDPKTDLRNDIRELANTITDRPDLIMHGLSRYYGLGPLHMLGLLGAPIPQTDISGSISAGRPIPGISDALAPERDPNAKFGRTLVEILGPVVGMGYGFWKAMESNDPDTWKVWERAMPTAIQSASKAFRRQTRGEESFRGGGAVAEFDPQNIEQRAENIAQAFGFATTRVNQRFELRGSQENLKRYWVIRRSFVLENFAFARISGDQEAMADARKALHRFNEQAPAPGLRIDLETLEKSIKQRFKRAQLRELGIPNELAFRGLYKRLEEISPEAIPGR